MPARRLRRWAFFALVLATTAAGAYMMFDILRAGGSITELDIAILSLFAVTFAWIAVAFWSAVAGFLLQLLGLDPQSLRWQRAPTDSQSAISARTAIVMPIYHEDPQCVCAGLEATYRSIKRTGQLERFHFFVLSDSTDEAVARAEENAWNALRRRLKASNNLFYRRRAKNEGRKAGNIAEFCRRWGGAYDFMIVLDADSVMTGDAVLALVRLMESNPAAGLIQTVPIPARQDTLFGRLLQFASCLYSPMLAAGQSFWQTDTANYWGHNAIIRIEAFAQSCGLPELPGKPPLGGEILSHDFVEAGLLRRAGWHVYVRPDIKGSYEEVPSNILDYAQRDRRWAQGNLQHLKLLGARGLHPVSRLHFLLGATAYLSSLLWLLMLACSTVDAVARALTANRFFDAGYQLFPNWPVVKTGLIFSLLTITIAMLLLPKLFGVLLCLLQRERRRQFGGAARLVGGAILETLFSVLIAPLMMTFHAYFVVSILIGHKVSWGPQNRDGRHLHWWESVRRTWLGTAVGILWGGVTLHWAPLFFWWLSPVLFGLLAAAPLVRWSSSSSYGIMLKRRRLLAVPSETATPAALRNLVGLRDERSDTAPEMAANAFHLPPEQPLAMPTQQLETVIRRARRALTRLARPSEGRSASASDPERAH